jgi:DNA-binding winged helix-turn-helix (wHTH) protein/tetratricopeptide (TPR) repeat protein
MKLFHSFRLDTVNHCLWRADERVSLAPKVFDVLRYLVEHPGRLVTQDELLEALWPQTYVNPEVIKKYILGIRRVLGDNATTPVFIETLPKRGYQFVAAVKDERTTKAFDQIRYPPKKMVGRDITLSELERYLQIAVGGQRQLIFVTGEPGVGKTMLADVLHQRAALLPNMRIARGQCIEGYGGKEAYYPMLEALGQLVRENDSSLAAQTLSKRAPTWWVQFPALVEAEGREALRREIVGATPTRMVREICEALEVLTAEHPLILILEDLQWVDPSTLDFISALARRREPAKLMLVGTYRPTDVALSHSPLKALKQDLQVHQLSKEITLERLGESAISEYLTTEFSKSSFAPGLSNLVFRHSGGNALFMVAVVQDLVKRGLIVEDSGKWKLTQRLEDIDPGVPETLQQMLELQFEQLSAEEQRVLSSASVNGEHFSIWAITDTVEYEPEQIEDICEELAQRQQFIRSAGIQEVVSTIFCAEYEFRHSLYRQAIYKKLSDGNRSRIHRSLGKRFATVCTPERPEWASEVAFHFEHGHEHYSALQYFIIAAENATRKFAHRDALEILQHAQKLLPKIPSDSRAELEIKLCELIGEAHYALGEITEAVDAYEMEVTCASQANLERAEVKALSRLAYSASPIDSERGMAASRRAVLVSSRIDDPELLACTQILAAAFRILHDHWSQEDAQLLAANLEIVKSSGTPLSVVHETLYASQAQILEGNYADALRIMKADLASINPASGLTPYLSTWGGLLALLHNGEFGAFLGSVRAVLKIAKSNGNELWPGAFIGLEAWLRTFVSNFEGGRRLSETVLHTYFGRAARTPRVLALLAGGQAELGFEMPLRAQRLFEEVIEMTAERFYLYWYWRMHARIGLARASLQLGNLGNARIHANSVLESALLTSDPAMQVLAWELKTKVAMAQTAWTDARRSIEAALLVLENSNVPVYAWCVHSTAWEFFRLQNDPETAASHRRMAKEGILALAYSFPQQESLLEIFLSSQSVRRIVEDTAATA